MTAGQVETVAKVVKHKTPITLRLTYNNLMRGDETVNLTQSQINELEKAKIKAYEQIFELLKPNSENLQQAEEALGLCLE